MANYRKILVAFDGSESGKNAIRQAIVLRDLEKSWIKVLAVVPAYEGDLELVGVSEIEKVLQGPREKLITAAEAVAREESTELMADVEQGEAYEKIVDVCDEESCDLIVMGRRGMHRLERMFMGSVTARVIGHAEKDVFVVPRDVKLSLENILLATDGSAHSEAALDRALHFAGVCNGKITAVSVVDVYPEFYAEAPEIVERMEKKALEVLDHVRKKAEKAGVKIETKVLSGHAAEEIVTLAGEIKAGVIFLGSRGRSGLKKLVMGSVAERVIGLANCPVLVVKA
jgi:nucleotide-binding universal stress UspA family protein